ncbi:MAG: hypothetical protein Kilf2KO_04870 [Rhodospirillales bacterium]
MTLRSEESGTGPSRPVLPILGPLVKAIYWSAVAIFSATIGALFLALFVNVLLRYAFDEGIAWAYEIPSILFPWAVASAVVIATVLGRHIQIALLVHLLPPRARRAVGLLVYLTTAAISGLVVWTSLPTLRASQFMRLAETGIPQIWGMSALIYALIAIALVCLAEAIALLAGGAYGEQDAERSLS